MNKNIYAWQNNSVDSARNNFDELCVNRICSGDPSGDNGFESGFEVRIPFLSSDIKINTKGKQSYGKVKALNVGFNRFYC